jgi:signal transduction histidine kinase
MAAVHLNVKNNIRIQIMKVPPYNQVQDRSDRIINYFLPAYFLGGLIFAYFYGASLDYFALQTFFIHVLLPAVIFFICGLWAYQLKKHSELEASQTKEMKSLQNEELIAVKAQKEQLERRVAVLDKAVAQGKFEIASDMTHDIGNAVIGFGAYLTRMKRLGEKQNPQILRDLAQLFTVQRGAIVRALGEAKTAAVIKVLSGISETQYSHQEEVSRVISKQTNIIANIQQILHIQRQYIDGYETQERKPVNLRNIIGDALALLFVPIDQEAIVIHLDIPDNLSPISGDRTKLIQVLVNVLKMSIGSIGLQAKEKIISIRVYEREGLVFLEIRDTGKGFDQYPDSTLHNCQAILESHGGALTTGIEGPGKGTTTLIQFSM